MIDIYLALASRGWEVQEHGPGIWCRSASSHGGKWKGKRALGNRARVRLKKQQQQQNNNNNKKKQKAASVKGGLEVSRCGGGGGGGLDLQGNIALPHDGLLPRLVSCSLEYHLLLGIPFLCRAGRCPVPSTPLCSVPSGHTGFPRTPHFLEKNEVQPWRVGGGQRVLNALHICPCPPASPAPPTWPVPAGGRTAALPDSGASEPPGPQRGDTAALLLSLCALRATWACGLCQKRDLGTLLLRAAGCRVPRGGFPRAWAAELVRSGCCTDDADRETLRRTKWAQEEAWQPTAAPHILHRGVPQLPVVAIRSSHAALRDREREQCPGTRDGGECEGRSRRGSRWLFLSWVSCSRGEGFSISPLVLSLLCHPESPDTRKLLLHSGSRLPSRCPRPSSAELA
ncbi:uncharacterized protein LOC144336028 [Macaca mulatta]